MNTYRLALRGAVCSLMMFLFSTSVPAQQVVKFAVIGEEASRAVAFSPDDTKLASAEGKILRLLDVATQQEIRRFTGHISEIHSVAFSPDGTRLTAAEGFLTRGTDVHLWEVSTGQEVKKFREHSLQVYSVAFSPDGTKIISGSMDRTLQLWDVETGNRIWKIDLGDETTNPINAVLSVAFSPGGKYIASGSFDGTVRLWDAATKQKVRQFPGGDVPVQAVAFSPDGSHLVSSYLSPEKAEPVRLWNAENGQLLRELTGHTTTVWSVEFSPDGKHIASGSDDGTVRLWAVSTGEQVHHFAEIQEPEVRSVDISSDGRFLAASGENFIYIADMPSLPTGLEEDSADPIHAGTAFLPETFAIVGNYPNPFRENTQLTFDLPQSAHVQVEVMDVIGRHLLTVPGRGIEAGRERTIEINGGSLPAGLYLYRLIADSPAGISVQSGKFVKTP